MSFILDALKKSELDRQRQTTPGFVETAAVPARARWPFWAAIVGALLVVNLIVLAVVLMHGRATGAASAGALDTSSVTVTALSAVTLPPAAGGTGSGASSAATPEHFSPLDAAPSGDGTASHDSMRTGNAAADSAPVYAPEIPVTGGDGPPPAAPARNSTAAAARPSPRLTDAHTDAGNDEVLPSISELNLTGPQGLPDLHLDVHVYATNPADRFVYINMRKYREGGTLQEGATLERIRRDGVVLNFHGLRFLLPRQ
jgi:general secretion pathway protein B